jgi:hypothetical protein
MFDLKNSVAVRLFSSLILSGALASVNSSAQTPQKPAADTLKQQISNPDFAAIKDSDKQMRILVSDNRDLTEKQLNALMVLATDQRGSVGCALNLQIIPGRMKINDISVANIKKRQHEMDNRSIRNCLVETIDYIANRDAAAKPDSAFAINLTQDRIAVQALLAHAREVFGNPNPTYIEAKSTLGRLILQ